MNMAPHPLETALAWFEGSSRILVGIGAGLSASAGMNYTDPTFFEQNYRPFVGKGYKTVWQAVGNHWDISQNNAQEYWGFWAWHIMTMYYSPPAATPYLDLAKLLQGRDYFVICTNTDGQIHKLGLDESKIFLPQGEYGLCQCPLPCTESVYPNKAMIDAILKHMNLEYPLAAKEDIPLCPHCGRYLVPNLRKDDHFVDATYQEGYPRYRAFLDTAFEERVLLLELGVGYNTPGIIRYPFEFMVQDHPQARLIRVNLEQGDVPERLGDHALGLTMDTAAFLGTVAKQLAPRG